MHKKEILYTKSAKKSERKKLMENNTTTKSLEEEKITQKKRQYWREHNSRHTKRRKLKNAVADFYTKLQEKRGTVIEKSILAGINIQIKNILNLPYCWTDKDWDRAMTALSDLEKKYLKRRYTNPPKDEAQLYEEIKNLLAESTLGLQPKINIVLNILQELVEQ